MLSKELIGEMEKDYIYGIEQLFNLAQNKFTNALLGLIKIMQPKKCEKDRRKIKRRLVDWFAQHTGDDCEYLFEKKFS